MIRTRPFIASGAFLADATLLVMSGLWALEVGSFSGAFSSLTSHFHKRQRYIKDYSEACPNTMTIPQKADEKGVVDAAEIQQLINGPAPILEKQHLKRAFEGKCDEVDGQRTAQSLQESSIRVPSYRRR